MIDDLANHADTLAGTERAEEEDRLRRVVRMIQANKSLTATQVAEAEGMHLWDVLSAFATLSESNRLLHSHTTRTGEEAWMVSDD
jgi:hypothetical protein